MNTDRELIEWAAKAAGICLEWDGHPDLWVPLYYKGKAYHSWDPLDDDGEAFRLALTVGINIFNGMAEAQRYFGGRVWASEDEMLDDPLAATRRAIVRTAAKIGKAMP